MIASIHVVHYRRRAFAPPKDLVGTVDGLRFWRPLNVGGDFAWFREHPSRWQLYRRLKPNFHQWLYYAVWTDEQAVDEFLASSPTASDWRENAVEAWHLWLRPLHVRGPWSGVRLFDADAKPSTRSPAQGGTCVAVLTRLDLTLRATAAMWGSAAPYVLHHLPASDQLLVGIPLVDRPYTQPVSFSMWPSAAAAARFGHRDEAHSQAVERLRRSQPDVVERFSFGRFQVDRTQGTYLGRNPVNGNVSPPNTTPFA